MEPTKRSPTPEKYIPEDPDTAAARKELRQTVISEKADSSTMSASHQDPAPDVTAGGDKASTKASTPDRGSVERQSDDLRDQVSSPKKKRAHDEVDEPRDATSDANGDVSPIGSHAGASLSRTDRSEPEKKRPRDVSSESKANSQIAIASTESTSIPKTGEQGEEQATAKDDTKPEKEKEITTSASAFSASGIAGFATQASPFLQAGSKPLSSFASPTTSQSPFGATSTAKPTTSVFGSSVSNGAASPFGQVGGVTTTFGSTPFSGSFASKLGGPTLSSFGKPGTSFKSNKPAKPFGAPVSEDEDNDEDDSNSGDEEPAAADEDHEATEEKATVADDKKKTKLQRVVIDDGEADEVTILQVRAKIFHLDKVNSAWKERGAGNLKINVPVGSVKYDETGAPVLGSFKASDDKDAKSNVVRLVMRQDSTHRVILNTVVIPGMELQEKPGLKATGVLFTAIEGGGAVSIQLKMNAANARSFVNEVGKIQRVLQSV
ncbi:hypothetical protein F5B19DRAFT_216509 [Rostrohypoxylon terebratum]|nr:hypothetical protein F5B19DRAFT_216509 [Rostrohypoxylon terebratum]